jgi:uncharacterized membrane protein YhdT
MDNYQIITYDFSGLTLLMIFALWALMIVSVWKIFEKAGEPGWKSIIPIYSSYIWYKIATGHGWTFLLACIPLVGWIYQIYATYKLAQAFDKGVGFTIGLIFLPIVFYPILGFDASEYYEFEDYDF